MYLQPSGSGAKYQGRNETFWEHHGEALIIWSHGAPEMRCKKAPLGTSSQPTIGGGNPTNNPKTLDSLIEGTKFGGELRFEDSDGEAIIKKP